MELSQSLKPIKGLLDVLHVLEFPDYALSLFKGRHVIVRESEVPFPGVQRPPNHFVHQIGKAAVVFGMGVNVQSRMFLSVDREFLRLHEHDWVRAPLKKRQG